MMEQRGAETGSTACRVFTFKDAKAPQESLRVCIPEVLDPQYGMYVWPCAVVLAQYLWFYRDQLRGRAVLELGAGVSLPGVVAARCGAEVILSDGSDKPMCLENCRRSCEANGLQDVTVLGLSWGDVSPGLLLLPKQDIVLGSDVFYDPEDFEDVLVTFVCLLRKNPKAQFWTTYQVRSSDWSIEALLHRWKLDCVTVPLADFDADQPELAGSTLPGNHSIQMMILTRRTEAE
ncbi:Methyltransferase-like protein 23 [Characodon lateralis]|uniref:Methyltransferase-like protein 23 n=1 Tax=Characodon lateralis TaxID=208331 RepID=A0ABU7DTY8_9TELE|nr:Methyltransferase-like protein 23 [Characodon lateralis]